MLYVVKYAPVFGAFLPPHASSPFLVVAVSSSNACWTRRERSSDEPNYCLFLLFPEGNFSSCIEGDYKVVSSPFPSQLDGHSCAATVLSISFADGKCCVTSRNASTVLLAWGLPHRNCVEIQDMGMSVFLCTLYSRLTASDEILMPEYAE